MNDDIKQPDADNSGDNGDDSLESNDSAPTITQTPETTKPEETSRETPAPATETKPASSGGSKVAVWVVLVVLALLIGGGLGYIFGANKDQSPTAEQQALQQQVTDLNNQLTEAQKNANTDKNDQITQLQQENANLKAENEQLTQKNADLQKQLDELEDDSAADPTN